ncbi:hypothetical protein FSHL1_002738 [Fusarium sambucinum]
MAEAVGLAASIAGLVQLIGSVFKIVTKFCKEAKDAPLLASTLETGDSGCALKMEYLDSCQQTLDKINTILKTAEADFDSGKSAKRFSRRLKWPFSLSETKDLVSDLSNHRANLHLALSADSMDALLKSLSKQEEIHSLIERKLSFDNRVQLSKRRKEVVQFFMRIKPQDYLAVCSKVRHEATGSWLIHTNPTFSNWKKGVNSKLWLSGIPGSGKTILCGLVIETVLRETEDSIAVCCAFCDYKNPDSWLPENIIAALIVQLALQNGVAFDLLEKYFNQLHPGNMLPTEPKLSDLMEKFQSMTENFRKVFLVVDGLDECGRDVSRVTQVLKSLSESSETVSAAFFSRKEPDISEQLEKDFAHIEVSADTKDLEDYTLAEVGKRDVLKRIEETNPTLYKELLHTLVQGAQGMFRWVTCQIDHICDLPNNNARKKALKQLPPTLFETYDRVLLKVMDCPAETQACVRKALHWLALGLPGMQISALCQAISIKQNINKLDADDIIDREVLSRHCGCLLRKSLDDSYFEFAHFTVLEYLRDTSIGDFRYSENDAYRSYAETAASFLLFSCFDREPSLIQGVEKSLRNERDKKQPFYPVANKLLTDFETKRCSNTARTMILEEEPIISLLKKLFYTDNKINGPFLSFLHGNKLREFNRITHWPAVALFFATVFGIPEICRFLLEKGVQVDINVGIEEDLCLLDIVIWEIKDLTDTGEDDAVDIWSDRQIKILNILLDNGAAASTKCGQTSSLALAFRFLKSPFILPFIRPTTKVPDDAVSVFLERQWDDASDDTMLQAILALSTGDNAAPQWKPMAAAALSHTSRRGPSRASQVGSSILYQYSDAHYPKALKRSVQDGRVQDLATLIADSRFAGETASVKKRWALLNIAAKSKFPCDGVIVNMLLEAGLIPEIANRKGVNSLQLSCREGNVPVAQALIVGGVNPSETSDRGLTAWHIAAYEGKKEIIDLLFLQDTNASQALLKLDMHGRTPFYSALRSGNVETCMSLLKVCTSDSEYFRGGPKDIPVLCGAARAGSRDLFQSLVEKGVASTETDRYSSTPFHHLGASTTVDLAKYIRESYNPLALDEDKRSPFETFFCRWMNHNAKAEYGHTVPLHKELLQILLPGDFVFDKGDTTIHAWQAICDILATKHLCCSGCLCSDISSSDHSDASSSNASHSSYDSDTSDADTLDSNKKRVCTYYLSEDLTTIFGQGVLLNYERASGTSGLVPIIKALIRRGLKNYCLYSVLALLSDVDQESSMRSSICQDNDSIKLLTQSITRGYTDLAIRLVNLGVEIHIGNPQSPFEMVCSQGNLETLKVMLAKHPPSDLSCISPSGKSAIELIVCGSSKEKVLMFKQVNDKQINLKMLNLNQSLVLVAAKQHNWELVKCLADAGDDLYVKSKHGWGVAHYAIVGRDLHTLKLLNAPPYGLSYWQMHLTLHWNIEGKKSLRDRVTPLHMAAIGRHSLLAYLFQKQLVVDANVTTIEHKRTALHYAAISGSVKCCRILIDHGGIVTAPDKEGKQPIHYALDYNHTDVVTLLSKLQSLIPSGENGSVTDSADHMQRLYFRKAIARGDLNYCKGAVRKGYSIDKPLPRCFRCTPLFEAIYAKKEDIVEWLLEIGATPQPVFCNHVTYSDLLTYAAYKLNSPESMQKVLTAVSEHQIVPYTSIADCIHIAATRNSIGIIRCILSHFELNDDRSENVFINNLANRFQPKTVAELINHPSSLPARLRQTPLQSAAKTGCVDMVKFLIHHGAELDSHGGRQTQALTLAIRSGHLPVVKELIASGASIAARDALGNTPMATAVHFGNLSMIKMLE